MTAHPMGPVRSGEEVLRVDDLKVHFGGSGGMLSGRHSPVRAVDGVTFSIRAGETLSLVGESGCGKSTTGLAVMGLVRPTSGAVSVRGTNIAALSPRQVRTLRQHMQIVFQDPYSSLSPRRTVGASIAEPLGAYGWSRSAQRERVEWLLERVGLRKSDGEKYPHEFSGGQRQRVGIARALALGPALVVLDEPVSALDVSIQAQVVNLLEDLQEEYQLAYLFVAHDLSVVRHISDRVAVMYLGAIVESGTRDQIFEHPRHPYTKALLSAVPVPEPDAEGRRERIVLEGDLPNPASPPSGCRFRTRCWLATAECAEQAPPITVEGTSFACYHPIP